MSGDIPKWRSVIYRAALDACREHPDALLRMIAMGKRGLPSDFVLERWEYAISPWGDFHAYAYGSSESRTPSPAPTEQPSTTAKQRELTEADIGRDCGPECLTCIDVKTLSPYDISPNPLTPATNGFILCPTCERVVELPHECTREVDWKATAEVGQWCLDDWRDRAEFAESLLCAMAFDHQADKRDAGLIAGWWAPCESGCVFCEAAR